MIVTTPIFRNLKKINPNLHIGVFASKTNAEIIRYNPFVDSIYVLHSNWIKLSREIAKARKQRYNIVINFIFNRTTSGGILSNIIAPSGIKVGQGADKYKFYFNKLLKLERNTKYMTELLAGIMQEVFGIKLTQDQLWYEIYYDDKTKHHIQEYWNLHHLKPRSITDFRISPYIVFNLSATDTDRRISVKQAQAIGQYLSAMTHFRTILFHAPNESAMISVKQFLLANTSCLAFPEQGDASLLSIAAFIEGAMAVITPDTSIIHFASAMKTPILGFYTERQNVLEWMPFQVKYRIVRAENNQPVSSIPISLMIQSVSDFIGELGFNHMNIVEAKNLG